MSEPKLSTWLPCTWPPALPGVYERMHGGATHFSRWDGRLWYGEAATVAEAADKAWPAQRQMLAWRGLAEPPR